MSRVIFPWCLSVSGVKFEINSSEAETSLTGEICLTCNSNKTKQIQNNNKESLNVRAINQTKVAEREFVRSCGYLERGLWNYKGVVSNQIRISCE